LPPPGAAATGTSSNRSVRSSTASAAAVAAVTVAAIVATARASVVLILGSSLIASARRRGRLCDPVDEPPEALAEGRVGLLGGRFALLAVVHAREARRAAAIQKRGKPQSFTADAFRRARAGG